MCRDSRLSSTLTQEHNLPYNTKLQPLVQSRAGGQGDRDHDRDIGRHIPHRDTHRVRSASCKRHVCKIPDFPAEEKGGWAGDAPRAALAATLRPWRSLIRIRSRSPPSAGGVLELAGFSRAPACGARYDRTARRGLRNSCLRAEAKASERLGTEGRSRRSRWAAMREFQCLSCVVYGADAFSPAFYADSWRAWIVTSTNIH